MVARLLMLAAAGLFSTGGLAIKSTTLNGWQTAGLRSLIAAITLWLLLPEARRVRSWGTWAGAFFYAITLVSFVHANKLTTSANAIFLQSTAPAYLLILGPLLLKEPVRRIDLWFGAALAFGMALFFVGAEKGSATAPNPTLGNWVAAGSGASYALTLTILRWKARSQSDGGSAIAVVAAGNLIAFLMCAPVSFPIASWTGTDAVILLYLGIFQIALAYWCLTRGMRQVPAFEASALLLLEPVLNPIWTWLGQGERPGAWAFAGGTVILLSTFLKTWFSRPSPAHFRQPA